MIKKLGYAGMSALLLLVIAGCGDKPAADSSDTVSGANGNAVNSGGAVNQEAAATPQPTSTSSNEGNEKPPVSTQQPETPEKQSQSIEVYYTDSQLMNLAPAKVTISYASAVEKYTEAFKALQVSENKEFVPLWGKIELKSLKFDNGQIVMDIHKPEEAQLGAGGEAYAISALTQTFFQFEEVKSIDVLVDGEQVESLMGHVDLVHPMTR